jgi:choline dehydrogenase-like flavoprotein
MTYDADAIVVGSGPSGVSVALPMLQAGMRVVLLDGGRERDAALPRGAYHDLRRSSSDQWRTFLGRELEALRATGPPSPKFAAPGARFAFDGFARSQRVVGRQFAVIGSLARGGLSNIWGAGIACYGEEELAEFPLTAEGLLPAYRRVARRIGVTGFGDDDLGGAIDHDIPSLEPMRLSENANRLLARYRRRRAAVQGRGLRIGRARTAVLTEPQGERGACALCDMCLWGCREDAIYSATQDLDRMQKLDGLDYRPGTLARSIARSADGFRVAVERGSDLTARRLVLAAGALTTTRLVLELQERFDEPVPLLGAPGIGFALCLPERVGSAVSVREFSMGQLSFLAEGDPRLPADDAYGTLFPASGIPGSFVIDRMPLTRPGAIRLFRFLQPALVLGNCFLPGRYSRNTAHLERDAGGGVRLVVQGGTSDDLPQRMDRLKRQITRAFRSLGAFAIPSSFSPIRPGEEIRYAGTLPMRSSPGRGEVDVSGELHGFPGLHIADLSSFPSMSAKHHTLTLMANADRVGHLIAERWRS